MFQLSESYCMYTCMLQSCGAEAPKVTGENNSMPGVGFGARVFKQGLQVYIHIWKMCAFTYAYTYTLRLNIAQKPCIIWSLAPKALLYESFEP